MQPEQPQGIVPQGIPPVPPQPEQARGEGQALYTPAAQPTYVGATEPTSPVAPMAPPERVIWDASEYIHTDKGGLWMISFALIVITLLGVAIWLSAWTFAALILVMAIAMAIFAFRPPRVLHYELDDAGVKINDQFFTYNDFRAFGVLQDGAFFTLTLIPVKRFAPALSVYFAEDHGEQIVDIVGDHLPMQQIEPDLIDSLMRRLRF